MTTKRTTPAQEIKAALKVAFPGVKFSCRYDSYSMGCSVHVTYTDGPALSSVEEITSHFQRVSGMNIDDSVNYSKNCHKNSADYVFVRREISPEIDSLVSEQVKNFYNWDHNDYYNRETEKREAWDYLKQLDLTAGTPDYYAYREEIQAREDAEWEARKIELAREEEEREEAKKSAAVELEKMFSLYSFTEQEKADWKNGVITTAKITEFEKPIIVDSAWPDMNKNNTLSEYHSEYTSGENTRKKARICAKVELSENAAHTFSENLLSDNILPSQLLTKYCGHDLHENDMRREEFDSLPNMWSMSKEQTEYYDSNCEAVCILVESTLFSCLINSEGSSYVRYLGFIESDLPTIEEPTKHETKILVFPGSTTSEAQSEICANSFYETVTFDGENVSYTSQLAGETLLTANFTPEQSAQLRSMIDSFMLSSEIVAQHVKNDEQPEEKTAYDSCIEIIDETIDQLETMAQPGTTDTEEEAEEEEEEPEEPATYSKYCPCVWLAKTTATKNKGETIEVANKYGKTTIHIVHNLIYSKAGYNYYSTERTGETYAERRAKRYETAAFKTEQTAEQYYTKSNKDKDFLILGEPIKIGHHSERKHRKAFEDAHRNMRKYIENLDKAREHERKAEYWTMKAEEINLSSPESVDFFTAKLEKAIEIQQEYKTGKREKEHSFSLNYATKAVKDLRKKVEMANKLWG